MAEKNPTTLNTTARMTGKKSSTASGMKLTKPKRMLTDCSQSQKSQPRTVMVSYFAALTRPPYSSTSNSVACAWRST